MSTRVVKLIVTDELRGGGVDGEPYWRCYQLLTLDGLLVCESGLPSDRAAVDELMEQPGIVTPVIRQVFQEEK